MNQSIPSTKSENLKINETDLVKYPNLINVRRFNEFADNDSKNRNCNSSESLNIALNSPELESKTK